MSLTATNKYSLEECISNLEERAKPSKNDIRYEKYVKYINCVLRKFGNERVYLVGSTGERSKLAYFKDDGDADFLMVSGKLEIPVHLLEPNPHAPCYTRIRVNERSRDIGLKIVTEKYLSANALREVRPELFTLLRAVYLQTTATVNKLPETDKERTVLSVSSKVGLQTTAYRSLQFDQNIEELKHIFSYADSIDKGNERTRRLSERWRGMKIHDQDKKIYRRVYDVLKFVLPSGDKRENNGGIALFAQFVKEIISRRDAGFFRTSSRENNESSKLTEDEGLAFQNDINHQDTVSNAGKVVKATYAAKNHKDFVPALAIKGKLGHMEQWKERVTTLGWNPSNVDKIYNSDVFVVARIAPINPNFEKDFCLSFNLAEKKLMKWTCKTQRQVYLAMKAFVKGVFERKHEEKGIELRLKTYHIKNLLFWLYERTNGPQKESVELLLKEALNYLQETLQEEKLPHYFIPSCNLFIDFEKSDFKTLIECVDIVQECPAHSLNFYIQMYDGKRGEVWFTEEELKCFLDMSIDGGREKHIDKLEEAMVDFQRGINDKRDVDGHAPLQEAIIELIEVFLSEDVCVDYSQFKFINDFLTNHQTEIGQLNTADIKRKIEDTATLVEGLGCYIEKVKYFVKTFGGKEGIKHILQGAFCGKPIDFDISLEDQILEVVRRYLACSDGEEDVTCSELKYKLAGYFLCKKEFPDMSGIRKV